MYKKLILHSGGGDSLAIMLDYIEKYGPEDIISLGFNYGQRHFKMENAAATCFCNDNGIKRIVLDVPIGQIGGCSLVDHSIPVTTEMSEQRSTVVPMRNGIFLMLASAVAQVNDCDTIVHGACAEDHDAYRDCRIEFFRFMEMAIQAGLTSPSYGSEEVLKDIRSNNEGGSIFPYVSPDKVDIFIETPLIFEKKEDTMKRVLMDHNVEIYKHSYSCYVGNKLSCGKCPACIERLAAFAVNGVKDPIRYKK